LKGEEITTDEFLELPEERSRKEKVQANKKEIA